MIFESMHRGVARRGGLALTALVVTVPIAACGDFVDELLDVEAPSRVIGRTLEDPGNASLLVESAIADFECAYAYYAMTTGLLTDELVDTQLAAATWNFDRRSVTPLDQTHRGSCNATGNAGPPNYTAVSTARWASDNALRLLDGWTDEQVPERQSLIARAAAYAGYSLILLGEGFCSAALDSGPELSSAEILAEAEARFTTAIAAGQATDQPDIVNMALVGRARARLDQGRMAEAAADAAQVPAGFVKEAQYNTASTRSSNHVFRWNNRNLWASVDPRFQNAEWAGVPDPRVRAVNTGERGADAFTIVWTQQKYVTEETPIPIATYEEARLIIAEATGGQTAVGIINDLHGAAGLPPFNSTDPQAIMD
ncbi:MAG: hypothetical protein ACRELX_18010, partial [Longimicrobiales bacterium]